MACALNSDGVGPVTVSAASGCRVNLPPADSAGRRILSFQLIQTDKNCGALVTPTLETALTYLSFYDANGALLGSVSYPTLVSAGLEDTTPIEGAAARWFDAAGASGNKAEGINSSAAVWAQNEYAFWTWSPGAAGTCDVVLNTMNAQGVLAIAADGTLQMSPGLSAPATELLGSDSNTLMTYGDTAGVLNQAAAIGFGGYPGCPEYALTFAAPGTDYPPPTVVPPPYFGAAVLLTVAAVLLVLAVALWVAYRRGVRTGTTSLALIEAQAKAAGASVITIR